MVKPAETVSAAAAAAKTAQDALISMTEQVQKAQEGFKAAHAAPKSAVKKQELELVCESVQEYDQSLCPGANVCKKRHPKFCDKLGKEGCFPVRKPECMNWHLTYPLSQLKASMKAKREEERNKKGNAKRSQKPRVSAKTRPLQQGQGRVQQVRREGRQQHKHQHR